MFDLERKTAEIARDLIWEKNLKPYDALHVATAIRAKVDRIDSFDNDLIDLSQKIGNPPIIIGKPCFPHQTNLLDLLKGDL